MDEDHKPPARAGGRRQYPLRADPSEWRRARSVRFGDDEWAEIIEEAPYQRMPTHSWAREAALMLTRMRRHERETEGASRTTLPRTTPRTTRRAS